MASTQLRVWTCLRDFLTLMFMAPVNIGPDRCSSVVIGGGVIWIDSWSPGNTDNIERKA